MGICRGGHRAHHSSQHSLCESEPTIHCTRCYMLPSHAASMVSRLELGASLLYRHLHPLHIRCDLPVCRGQIIQLPPSYDRGAADPVLETAVDVDMLLPNASTTRFCAKPGPAFTAATSKHRPAWLTAPTPSQRPQVLLRTLPSHRQHSSGRSTQIQAAPPNPRRRHARLPRPRNGSPLLAQGTAVTAPL